VHRALQVQCPLEVISDCVSCSHRESWDPILSLQAVEPTFKGTK